MLILQAVLGLEQAVSASRNLSARLLQEHDLLTAELQSLEELHRAAHTQAGGSDGGLDKEGIFLR